MLKSRFCAFVKSFVLVTFCAQMAILERLDKLILLIEHPLREVEADHD